MDVPFIIHKHKPRSGSEHYDLRILDPKNSKLLHSFAFGSDFLKNKDKKITGVKTRDHDPRWLKLKSYRLNSLDEGNCTFHKYYPKYFEIEFHGDVLDGKYKLFKIKTKRDDQWLLIKDKQTFKESYHILSKII